MFQSSIFDPSIASRKLGGTLFFSVPTADTAPSGSNEPSRGYGHGFDLSESIAMTDSYPGGYDDHASDSDSHHYNNHHHHTNNNGSHNDYHQDSDSDSDGNRSPPMSLFLDRQEPAMKPAAIYLDVPPPVSSATKGALDERLLAPPPNSIPLAAGRTTISYKRYYRDAPFAVLYVVALVAYFILGIVLLFSTSSSPIDGTIYTVYTVIKGSAGMLTFLILLSVGLGTTWLFMLRSFARPMVWATVLSVPFVAVSLFIWSIVSAFTGPLREGGGPDPQDDGLALLSTLPIAVGTVFAAAIYSRRQYIARTTNIIDLACEILKENPDMFLVSVGLMAVHIVFTAVWLVFFARVFLIGHIESVNPGRWVLEGNFYPIAAFLIFMFLWTSAVLTNIQRVTLSGVVSRWYFHRHEPFSYKGSNNVQPALMRALTTSFGSVALGGLFLAIVQFASLALKYSAKKLRNQSFPLFVFLATCCSFVQGLVENFNNYTLIYVGITEESLFSAARSASKLFHRNLLWGVISDFLTKLILFVNSLLLSLLTGFAAYIFATHTLQSPYGYIIGILAAIIPFYVSQFFTHIMAITVDATFVCWAIDLDTDTCHSNKAHQAFGTPTTAI